MSGGGSNGSNIYQYGSSPSADSGAVSGAGSLAQAGNAGQSLYSGAVPGLSGLTSGTNYNPQSTVNAGTSLQNAGANFPGYANQALRTGFNDNNGLYNQELGHITDQTNVANAQAGIAGTPYGAGVLGQTLTGFNNNWNNQQLHNEATSAGTAGSLLGADATATQGGANVAQAGGNEPLNALQSLLSSGNLSSGQLQQAITDYLSYMSGGTSASFSQDKIANQQEQMNNQALGGLGSLFGTVAGLGTGGGATVGGSALSSIGSGLSSLGPLLAI